MQQQQTKGWQDTSHDWRPQALLKVPTWAPEHMQFSVTLLKCRNCQAYMTTMAGANTDKTFYVTPFCQEQQEEPAPGTREDTP